MPAIIPIAAAWIARQERIILKKGEPLNAQQLADAVAAGVAGPERLRLMLVEKVPLACPLCLQSIAITLGLNSPQTIGLTARYGIYIQRDFAADRALIAHEIAHTAQYERLGGIAPFLRKYLSECLLEGYPFGSLEIEAAEFARRVCG